MTDLVEFLTARLDEDEERARFVQREQGDRALPEIEPWRLSWHDEYDLLCIEPTRALAEVASKRRQLDLHSGMTADRPDRDEDGPFAMATQVLLDTAADRMLRLLALPYADHPDYRDEWRP